MESEKDPDAGPKSMPAILMYHSISAYQEDPYDITVRPERFDQQMRWLRRAGRKGTSVGHLLEARRRASANGLVGLSFDDGYADFLEYALPVLQRYGFGATMFVPACRPARRRERLGSGGAAQGGDGGGPVAPDSGGRNRSRLATHTVDCVRGRARRACYLRVLAHVVGQVQGSRDVGVLHIRREDSPRGARILPGVITD